MNLKQVSTQLNKVSTQLKAPKELKIKIKNEIASFKLVEALLTVFFEVPIHIVENLLKEKGGDNNE